MLKIILINLFFVYFHFVETKNVISPNFNYRKVNKFLNLTELLGEEPIPDAFITTEELIAARNLIAEHHHVITDDGYILALHRIKSNGTPVLLQHGMLATSDSWLLSNRQNSLPLILSDAGYDVWLGDQRGNAYSLRHLYFERRHPKYWNYSFHECGIYDLSAFIDYILEKTGYRQLIYMGHSMGTTQFAVLTSVRPEYNQKIKLAILMAPVLKPISTAEVSSEFLRRLIPFANYIYNFLTKLGIYELLPRTRLMQNIVISTCNRRSKFNICLEILRNSFKQNPRNLDKNRISSYASHFPAGVATKAILHYTQLFQTGRFQHFDYGRRRNLKYYKSPIPPEYELYKITAPVAFYYSNNDVFLNKRSTIISAKDFQNIIKIYEVPEPTFSHLDFVLGENAGELLFLDILKLLHKYSGR